MNSDMYWTSQVGNAFLVSQQAVMDSVQRQRQASYRYGYLRSTPQVVVTPGPYIGIAPVDPGYVVVPYYDPGVVFFAPRPGFVVGGAINFGFGVTIGGFFRPWGWGVSRWDWGGHIACLSTTRSVERRTWVNRGAYVHPYDVRRYSAAPPAERHQMIYRSPAEREAPRGGARREEEHGRR